MIPNAEMIERWSAQRDDGYVEVPASGFHELLWVLRQAEKAEGVVEAARKLSEAHERRSKDAQFWTLAESGALAEMRLALLTLESSRSFAA